MDVGDNDSDDDADNKDKDKTENDDHDDDDEVYTVGYLPGMCTVVSVTSLTAVPTNKRQVPFRCHPGGTAAPHAH